MRLLAVGFFLFAQTGFGFDQNHLVWNEILKNHVKVGGSQSLVDYKAIKKNQDTLDLYLSSLSRIKRVDFKKWSESERLSFLINAYNAFTVKLIAKHYPVESIKDIGALFQSAWKTRFFTLFGKKHHLDYIEHEVIRKDFDEPRIHFALVCAAKSCPMLRNEAYVASKLESQLTDATKIFLNDKKRNFLNTKNKKIHVSSIFKWYGDDFNKKHGSAKNFIIENMDIKELSKEDLRSAVYELVYEDYDWSLNEVK